MKRVLFLLILTASILPPSLGLPSVSGLEPLIFSAQSQTLHFSLPPSPRVGINQMGLDNIASVDYTFLPNGQVEAKNNQGYSLMLSPLVVGTQLLNFTLPFNSFSYNSTTVEYSLSANLGTITITITIIFSRVGQSLSLEEKLTGTLTIPSLVSRTISGAGRMVTGRNSTYFGNMGYDWSKTSGYNPLFNNQTRLLSWSFPASFNLDPVAIDGTNTNPCTSASTMFQTIVTTASATDLLITAVAWGPVTGIKVQSVTDTDTGTGVWKPGQTTTTQAGTQSSLSEYYKFPVSAGTHMITTTFSASTSGCEILSFGISGLALGATGFFDTAAEGSASGTDVLESRTVSLGTNYASEMVLGLMSEQNGNTITPDASFTAVSSYQAALPSSFGIYQVPAASRTVTVSGITVLPDNWLMLTEAVCPGQGCSGSPPSSPACSYGCTPFQGFQTSTVCPAGNSTLLGTIIGCYPVPIQLLGPNVLLVTAFFTGFLLFSTISPNSGPRISLKSDRDSLRFKPKSRRFRLRRERKLDKRMSLTR